jgi:type I restriction enzyme S subunit
MSGKTSAVREPSTAYAIGTPEMERVPPGYKQTEVGVIPEDWGVVKMGSLANILRGASPRPINSPIWFDDQSNTGWLRISDLSSAGKYLTETSQNLSAAGISNSRFVEQGNLVMSICATVGRPVLTRKDVCIHDGFVVFDNLRVPKEYLYYVLENIEKDWSKRGQTGSQMNLNTGLIDSTLIPLAPTEAEQRAIAAALSDVDALISSLDRLIAKKRAVKIAAMQQLLTGKQRLPSFSEEWEVKRLGDVIERIVGGGTPSRANSAYWGNEIPWVTVKRLRG